LKEEVLDCTVWRSFCKMDYTKKKKVL